MGKACVSGRRGRVRVFCAVAPFRSGYGPGGVFLSDHKTGVLPGDAVSHRERAIFS